MRCTRCSMATLHAGALMISGLAVGAQSKARQLWWWTQEVVLMNDFECFVPCKQPAIAAQCMTVMFFIDDLHI